jgi:hypothetical protein
MSNTKTELLKLAKALGKSGYKEYEAKVFAELFFEHRANKPRSTIEEPLPARAFFGAELAWAGFLDNRKNGKNSEEYGIAEKALDGDEIVLYVMWRHDNNLRQSDVLWRKARNNEWKSVSDASGAQRPKDKEYLQILDEKVKLWRRQAVGSKEESEKKEAPKQKRLGPWVAVQKKLNELGASLKTDGWWGPLTSAAWNKLTKENTTSAVPADMKPTEALAKLQKLSPAAKTVPQAEQTETATATSDALLSAYVKFPTGDGRLNLSHRDSLYKNVAKRTPETMPEYAALSSTWKKRIGDLYKKDEAVNPEMELILGMPAEAKSAKPTFNSSEFFAVDNIRMRKSDGALFYVANPNDQNTISPLSQRDPEFLNLREQRRMMAEIRREEKSPAKRRLYRQKISGQRKRKRGLSAVERGVGTRREQRGMEGLTGKK